MSGGKVIEFKVADLEAEQGLGSGMVYFDEAADFVAFAFGEGENVNFGCYFPDMERGIGVGSRGESGDCVGGEGVGGLDAVIFQDFAGGGFECMCECAGIGEYDESFAGGVEAACGEEVAAGWLGRQQIDCEVVGEAVASAADVAAGFIEHIGDEGCGFGERLVVEEDLAGIGDGLEWVEGDGSVEADAAGADGLGGLAAAEDA